MAVANMISPSLLLHLAILLARRRRFFEFNHAAHMRRWLVLALLLVDLVDLPAPVGNHGPWHDGPCPWRVCSFFLAPPYYKPSSSCLRSHALSLNGGNAPMSWHGHSLSDVWFLHDIHPWPHTMPFNVLAWQNGQWQRVTGLTRA